MLAIANYEYSLYYGHDEEMVGNGHCWDERLTLFDTLYDLVVSDDIHSDSAKSTVEKYLERNLKGKPLISITTDGRNFYKSIMDLLNGEHQLCYVHYIKNLNKKFKYTLNSCKSEDERNKSEKHIKGI
jgi:hypothetical protein